MVIKHWIKLFWNWLNGRSPSKLFFTKDILDGKQFIIGDYTYGNPQVLFSQSGSRLTIGKFCSIADGVTIFLGGNHRTDWITTYPFNSLPKYFPQFAHIKGHPVSKGDVSIGNDVWIGRNATILSGVKIGNGAVIATESVIVKDIGPYEIWGGNPAKLLKKRFDEEKIKNLETLAWWDWEIEKIEKNVEFLCNNDLNLILNKNVEKD